MKIKNLSENWLNYSWKYRPSAFWFWNEDMEEERMESMLALMERDGIREVLFHPVHGLTIEYLSPEFCQKYQKGLELAQKHNLKVWIYDEYSWPSGCVAGFLNRCHPEYIGWYLAYENGQAIPKKSVRVHDGTTGAPWTRSEGGYVDTLNFDAMKCYINMNYNKLKEACGKYWDDVILGFFTDEPATMMPYEKGNFWNAPALPWTEKLPEFFIAINGYPIEPYYNELFKPGKNKYKSDYFKVVKYLYCNAYHKQLGDWCKSQGKFYTGHLGEDSVHQEVRYGGSLYESLSHMTHPGVDFLNVIDPDKKYDQEIVASIAKHSSQNTPKNVFMEAYGISKYTLTLAEMYYEWQAFAVQRVNDIALMGMQHSTSGIRKRTYWPPFTEDEPWWDYYPKFRDAAARCQGISNFGKDIRKYAIMYPQYEIEQYSTTVVDGLDPIQKGVYGLIEKVCSSQNQYDWVFPEIIKDATVQDGKIVFPNETYDAILATSDFEYFHDTEMALQKLENQGGNIIREKINNISLESPVWSNIISISDLEETANDIETEAAPEWTNVFEGRGECKSKVYTYEYEDGYILAIRNICDNSGKISVTLKDQSYKLYEWNPEKDKIYNTNGTINKVMRPHSCIYFSVTKEALNGDNYPVCQNISLPIEFSLKADKYNTAPFASLKAYHKELGLVDITNEKAMNTSLGRFYGEKDESILNNNGFPTLPDCFKGYSDIKFEAEFNIIDKTKLGILAEGKYIKDVAINSIPIFFNKNYEFIWDWTNVYIDLTDYIKEGINTLTFTLSYGSWETSVENEAFFAHYPKPSVDVCLAGDFIYIDNTVKKYESKPKSLPITLENEGFKYTYGKAYLAGTFTKTDDMKNLFLDIIGDSACEVIIDGKTLDSAITNYVFNIENIQNGKHYIKIILTGVSASLMDFKNSNKWSLVSVKY